MKLRLLAWTGALVLIALASSLYLQPDFMVTLAEQVWSCF